MSLKHVGTRCCKLNVTWKGKHLSDDKRIIGAERLTNETNNINANMNELNPTKISDWETLFHNFDIANELRRYQFTLIHVNVCGCGG